MERSPAEIERLISENKKLVYRVARQNFTDRRRDEDLLQCGMIGLWEAAKDWTDNGDFTAWAARCIKRNMLDYLRSEKNVPSPIDRIAEEFEERETAMLDHIALTDRIKAVWPENSRERLILIALSSGVSIQAVAVSLGIQTRTAKQIAQRAMDKLEKDT